MTRRSYMFLTLALLCTSCVRGVPPTADTAHVLLVADWQNSVVHRIGLDGTYEGDFLAPERQADATISRSLWMKPSAALFVDGSPGAVWILADRAVGAWDASGRTPRTVFSDTQHLETPTCVVRAGERVYIATPDKKQMLVFGLDGAHLATFGFPHFYHVNDCKLGPDGKIYAGTTLNRGVPGLVSIWNPNETGPEAQPLGYRIPGDSSGDETFWVHSLEFDDDGKLLITEFSRGRLERWDLDTNSRIEVLLDSENGGEYLKLQRGPDGLIYMAGPTGIYRFDSRAKRADLESLQPFFDAEQLESRYAKPFAPAGLAFAPRAALGPPR